MKDPFLSDYIVNDRLYSEWIEHKGLIVAFDFDNTVFDYHKKGYTFEAVIGLLQECKGYGCKLICFTARGEEDYQEIEDYLLDNNIPWDTINEDVINVTKSRKPYYNILLDDRAGLRSAYKTLKNTLNKIKGEMKNV